MRDQNLQITTIKVIDGGKNQLSVFDTWKRDFRRHQPVVTGHVSSKTIHFGKVVGIKTGILPIRVRTHTVPDHLPQGT